MPDYDFDGNPETAETDVCQPADHYCTWCGDDVPAARWAIGYRACLPCGEDIARAERSAWCVVPLHKSNYFLCTDRTDLKGINNKGGLVK